MIGIYKITSPSGKVYIGQSWDIRSRFWRYNASHPLEQYGLQNSFNKYGVDKHKFEVVHELPIDVSQEVLNTYEQLYMDAYRDCGIKLLNCKEAGANGKLSEETKQRIGLAQVGKKRSEETKNKMSAWQIGKIVSEQTRENIAASKRGATLSQEHKNKISTTLKGKVFSEERNRKVSESLKGVPKSKDHNKKVSETRIRTGVSKGENNGRAKLTENIVKEIRSTYVKGQSSLKAFCEKYSVGKTAMAEVINGKKWAHVNA
jgi:group I intron endonuclease